MFRGEISVGYEIASQLLHLAEQGHESGSPLGGHLTVGFSHVYAGRFAAAQDHFERVLTLYDVEQHHPSSLVLVSLDMVDPRVVCGAYTAQILWFRGYADQARKRMEKVYALAQDLAQTYLMATVLNLRTMLSGMVEDPDIVARHAAEHIEYATQQGFPHWAALGMVLHGWALSQQGQTAYGVDLINRGLAAWQETGMHLGQTGILSLLVDAYGRNGQEEEGLQVLAKALALAEHTGEYFNQAELYRLKGELTLQKGARDWGLGALSGVGFSKGAERVTRRAEWQDGASPAYWDITTYFSEPEGHDVLPEGSVSMDGGGHQAPAALKQTASSGVSIMERGDGVGALVCAHGGESVRGGGVGAQAQHGAPTIAGVVL